MTAIVQSSSSRPLAQRVRQALDAQKLKRERCLLLDVSGSMAESVEPGRAKIDALREIAAQFGDVTQIIFSDSAGECAYVPEPGGNTNLATALRSLHARGISRAVLITDGHPSEPEPACLAAARGLHLDIFYVGPAPEPQFLRDLAAATGGSFGATSLARENHAQLASNIRGLLGPGKQL